MFGNISKVTTLILYLSLHLVLYSSILFARTDDSNITKGLRESSGFTYNDFITGSFRTRYDGRLGGDEDDHDLYQNLHFKTKSFFKNKVTISGSGRLSEDLDGHEHSDGTFSDILDTYDHSVTGRVYYMYADIKDPVTENSKLRIGRQYQYSVETVLFDGAKYEHKIGPVETYAFGGIRASQYKGTYTDTVVGGGVSARPFAYTYTNLDYVRIEDDDQDDDEIGINLWQKIYGGLNFYGKYTILDNDPKEFLVKLSWDKFEWDLSMQLSYFRFVHPMYQESNNISPLYEILGAFEPFDLISLSGYKGFGEKYSISSGIDCRRVIDHEDENTFNRNYYRSFLSFTIKDVLLQESAFDFTIQYWNAEGIDHNTDLSANYSKKIGKFDVGVGSSYSIYKYNFTGSNSLNALLDAEYTSDIEQKISIRTYFLKLKYLLTERSNVGLQWTTEVSDTDPETFHRLSVSYGLNF